MDEVEEADPFAAQRQKLKEALSRCGYLFICCMLIICIVPGSVSEVEMLTIPTSMIKWSKGWARRRREERVASRFFVKFFFLKYGTSWDVYMKDMILRMNTVAKHAILQVLCLDYFCGCLSEELVSITLVFQWWKRGRLRCGFPQRISHLISILTSMTI